MPDHYHYFAADGNYGSAKDLVVIDTSQFTDDDWDRIEATPDVERGVVAMRIQKERNNV